jgi:uncharacterized protein YgiM (DUF1202 family)
MIMKRPVQFEQLFLFLLVALLFLGFAAGQTATVTRNVTLRPDASANHDPIRKLTPGAQLQLLQHDATAGYYHLRTSNSQEGFVWGRNIQIQAGPGASVVPSQGGPVPSSPPVCATSNTRTGRNQAIPVAADRMAVARFHADTD